MELELKWFGVETAWEKSERIATYTILVTLLVAELLSIGVPSLRQILDNQGEIVLLALALLLVFRMIVRHLEGTAASIEAVTFGVGVATAADPAKRNGEFLLLANDASRYYHHVSEHGLPAVHARLILCDVSQAPRWTRLVDRGLLSSLEVRLSPDRPILHFMVVGSESATFGTFHRRKEGGVTPGDTFLISGRTVDGRTFIEGLQDIFETAWADSTSIIDLGGAPTQGEH